MSYIAEKLCVCACVRACVRACVCVLGVVVLTFFAALVGVGEVVALHVVGQAVHLGPVAVDGGHLLRQLVRHGHGLLVIVPGLRQAAVRCVDPVHVHLPRLQRELRRLQQQPYRGPSVRQRGPRTR